MNPTHTLEFAGCRTTPLAHYLKALGILRLIAEQADAGARGMWKDDRFYLVSRLDRAEMILFFQDVYRPSPVVAPWNGGSGFNPNDNSTALDAITDGESSRHASYRQTIAECHTTRTRLGIDDKVSGPGKDALLQACRSRLPDDALDWFDAAVVLLDGGPQYPPLLGTGGNDGRLDFTNNYMQRLNDVINPLDGTPTIMGREWLNHSLFAEPADGLARGQSIGQFFPGAAGGANGANGFDAQSLINPWDFIFMLEGALFFASASTRRLGESKGGTLSAPFTVRASGVGYGSSSISDPGQSRGELWLPIWSEPASYAELRSLFSEGRASLGRKPARNGVDFARAIATLGIDRGIDAFERIGLHERNGLAYFAIPLGRIEVKRQPQVDLLSSIDAWLDSFLRSARGKNAPGRVVSAARRLEEAIFHLTQHRSAKDFQALLISLGNAHDALCTSFQWTKEQYGLRPLVLADHRWVTEGAEESVEYRLASALAGLRNPVLGSLRQHLEPVERRGKKLIWSEASSRDVVWRSASLEESLLATMKRRLIRHGQESSPSWRDTSSSPARLDDIAAFIEGRVDEARLEELLRGLILVDFVPRRSPPEAASRPGAPYALMKLCFAGCSIGGVDVPINTTIVHRAIAGSPYALTTAARRLRASALAPAIEVLHASPRHLRRAAAALLFPIAERELATLTTLYLRPHEASTN
ncbi:MAG: type I-U CRISPR-associated protein Csx17 [Bradymonadaceae bacterium]